MLPRYVWRDSTFMNTTVRRWITGVLVFFLAASLAWWGLGRSRQSGTTEAGKTETVKESGRGAEGTTVMVYYFHGAARCVSCTLLEEYAKEAVEQAFPQELAAGKMHFLSVDVMEAQNRHFLDDFALTTQSVILTEQRGDEILRWKNLDRIWNLLNDKPSYVTYVQESCRAFLEGQDG